MSGSFYLPGSVPRGNGLTGKSTQGKSDLEENFCVVLCNRYSASLSRDLSHLEKGKMNGSKNTQISVDTEHAVVQEV